MQLSFINAPIVRNQFTFSNKIKLHIFLAYFLGVQILSLHATPHFFAPTTRTLVVNTTSDTHAATPSNGNGLDNAGNVSLRSALEAANAVGGTSIITLSASTYTLSLGAITIGTNSQNITINGVDSSSTVVQMSGTLTDRILLINPTGAVSGITTTINKVQFRDGLLNSDANGGGAIIAGGPLNSLTLNLCEFKNNSVAKNNGEGGAVRFNGGGTLNIDKCIFIGNTDSSFNGGAVSYFLENMAAVGNGVLNITNSIFEKNTTLGNGFGGAGIVIATQGRINGSATFSANILKNNFVSNQSSGTASFGGAIKVINEFTSGNNININYNRFFNNKSTIAPDALVMINSDGSINAINNWWGCNNGPSITSGCNNASLIGTGYGGTLTNSPYLKLNVIAPNDTVCISNTQTITAGFLTNSSNTLMDSSNLTALINLPISFAVVNGSVSNVQSVIQNSGTAKFSFTAQSTSAISTIHARLDSIPLNDIIAKKTINIFGPQITNPVISTGIYGTLFNQNFTQVGGAGTVGFTSVSSLPNGITLSSSGNLAGNINEVDTFPIAITATDVKGCTGNSNYTLITYLPTLSVTGTLNLFTACNGTVSTSQSIIIQGDHLSDKIIVKAPADFELSRSASGSYADTLQFTVAGDLTTATVFIRLKSTASGSPSGNISIESINAITKTKSISGAISLRPTSFVSGSTTICNGDSTTVSIALTGTPPWNVNYTDGSTPVTVTGIISSPYAFKVAPSTIKTYTITSLSDANCAAIAGDITGTAIINVNARPTSFITGSATICKGDSSSINIALTGTQPWSITYTDGTTPVTVAGIVSNLYTFKVAPPSTKNYTVTSLSDANCTSISSDKTGSAVISVNARPTSLISGSANLCIGDSAIISIALTGTQPWNITYTDGTTPVIVTGIVSSPYNFKVAPSTGKTYTVTSLSDANCTAIGPDKTGSAIITVNARPTSLISGNATICNGDSSNVSVNLSGTPPWSVTYTDGTTPITITGIVSTPYNFKVAPSSTKTYSVTSLIDANCTAIASGKTGSAIITVNARPASIISGSATICNGDSTNISIALIGAQPWNITYTDGTTPLTVTGIVSSPYTFKVAPSSTKNYSVTSLSDANCTAIEADKTGTAVITVNARPTSIISGSTNICIDDSAAISIALTGAQPWSITYTDGSIPVTVNGIISSLYTFKVAPSSTKTYSVTSLSDANCNAKGADITGSVLMTVKARPSSYISGSAAICNGDSATINIALTGAQPWSITYTDGTTPVSVTGIVSSPYTFKVAPSSTKTYTVTSLSDANCTSIGADKTGTALVTVNNRPTSLISGSANLCTGDSSTISIALTGLQPWNITYTDGTTPVTVNGIVSSPYTFKVAPSVTKTYIVATLSDVNCTSIGSDKTGSAIITVNARPTSSISGSTTICNGDSATISMALTGTQPWSITYTDGTIPVTVTGIVSSPYVFKVAPSSTKTYTVTSLRDINCEATNAGVNSQITITVNPSPRASITGSVSVIKNSSSPEVDFSGSLGRSPYTFGYTLNNGPILTVSSGLSVNAKLVVPTSIAGTYIYKLVSVQDDSNQGCKSMLTDSVIVKVIDNAPSGLTYDPSILVYNGGDSIKKMIPTSKGGTIDYYEISPTLPAGLTFNTVTGEITGVCNSLLPTKEFTVTAFNSGGFTSCKITITINILPSLSSFKPINAKYGDQDIAIVPPITNSDGVFTYSSSNSAVALVVGNKIRVIGAGVAKITAVQASTNNYLSGSISTDITVAKSILTIKVDDKAKCQGTVNPVLTYTVNGFVNGDGLNSLLSIPTLITDASTSSAVGSYTIMGYGANISNYEITYQLGNLLINPVPYVKVSSTYSIVSKGTNVVLNGIGDGQFSWSPATYLASPNSPISLARVIDKTTYTATVTNQSGCVNISSVTVDVFDEINVSPAVVFTPNGDGINDKFVIKNIDIYPQNKLQIFDRTGKTVYEKTNYQNDWDGTIAGGIKITKETYYYTLSVNGNVVRRGTITLLR
jgi:gliding motility-associated-like protein